MDEVIAWATFAGAWLLVAGPLYQGSVELNEMDVDREGIQGKAAAAQAAQARPGQAIGVVVAPAAGHVRAVPPLEQGAAAGRAGAAHPDPARRPFARYRGRMASHPVRPQLGLFDNPVRVFSLDELAATVRKLERERPGRTVEELSGAVFTELAIKRTQRAADLVAEAIRLARPRQPGTEITGSRWQASTAEVRNWALSAGFELGAAGTIPGPAITAYNQTHPGRPY